MIRLAQSETYHPAIQEPSPGVTAIAVGICRLNDNYWYDWNDSTFKTTPWTTQYLALTESENGMWLMTTPTYGWAIPNANKTYKVQWKITDGTGIYYLSGEDIVVNSGLLDVLETVNGKLPTNYIMGSAVLTAKDDEIDAILEDTGTTLPATLVTIDGKLDTIDNYVDTEVAAIKAKTDNLPASIKKNTALANFEFLMIDSADHVTPKTGLTVTATRSIDGGAFGACANAVTEVASGIYKISLDATDLNGNVVTLKFTSVGADARYVTIFTQT